MKFAMDFPKALAGNVSVNFCCADARVAEQLLYHAEVRAVLE
jgi:hypothetical protein